MTEVKELLTHPASLLSSGLALIGIAVKPAILHAVFAAVWSSAGTLFTAASIAAFSLVPNIEMLAPLKPVAVGLALITGAVYLVKLAEKVLDEFQKRL